MRLKNTHIIALSVISLVTTLGLIYYQYRIIDNEQSIAQQQLDNNLTAFGVKIISLSDAVKSVTKSVDSETYKWEFLSGANMDRSAPAYEFIYSFDSVYRQHGLKPSYKMKGLMTKSKYCQIEGMDMGRNVPDGQRSPINNETYVSCLCHLSAPYTFDIGYTLVDLNTVMSPLQEPTVISMVLVIILFLTSSFTIYALGRQKKISELKESFVNTLSHNFKTPIFSISLAIKSLKKLDLPKNDSSTMKYLDLIASENMRLKNYSEKMLHEALVATEKLDLDLEELAIEPLLDEVIGSLLLIAEQNEVSIVRKFTNTNDALVNADRTHLFNTFYNILDNAIKYSNTKGTVEVILKKDNRNLVIKFLDWGIGMDTETLKNAFKKYYRGNAVNNSKGFGLGLSYVKRIIDAHHFDIDVESQVGKGTTISLTLRTIGDA
ncbi:MAG: HAMP domain-containing sensor histidine kinase [Cyclobacteriaceae bacterium]